MPRSLELQELVESGALVSVVEQAVFFADVPKIGHLDATALHFFECGSLR